MSREAVLPAAALATCALLTGFWPGCDDECQCPDTPRVPVATPVLTPLKVTFRRDTDGGPPVPVIPAPGSLRVTSDAVVIEYLQAGLDHRVVYDVVPNAAPAR